jgi:hypothetical protein
MRMARALGWLALAVVLPVGACYRYVPAHGIPEAGRPVRIELREEGAVWLRPQLGPDVTELDGVLLQADSQQLSILLQSYVSRRNGVLSSDDAVRLTPRHFIAMREKRLDRVRSILLGAAVTAGALLAIEVFGPDRTVFEDVGPEDPGPPKWRPPPAVGLRIPLPWRLPR